MLNLKEGSYLTVIYITFEDILNNKPYSEKTFILRTEQDVRDMAQYMVDTAYNSKGNVSDTVKKLVELFGDMRVSHSNIEQLPLHERYIHKGQFRFLLWERTNKSLIDWIEREFYRTIDYTKLCLCDCQVDNLNNLKGALEQSEKI